MKRTICSLEFVLAGTMALQARARYPVDGTEGWDYLMTPSSDPAARPVKPGTFGVLE